MSEYTPDEIMTITAARMLQNDHVCFVGIGMPSAAANVARLSHAPDVALIYESGTVATKPDVLPLSIGDGELAETARAVVSVPEMFRYWLQGGKIDVGFLGAAQIDKYGNINTTTIGDYDHPKVRLPGGGGAPEIATQAGEIFIIIRQSHRGFVEKLDFVTSVGQYKGGNSRDALGIPGKGPTVIVTDLGVLKLHPESREFIMTTLHPGVSKEQCSAATGWELKFADEMDETIPPSDDELKILRDLNARTAKAHEGK
ncbi:3-oxoadipate CoA-transferase subunit B [Candidatus Terasakiella magnetica]|uniref:3-oxoadipate CoA-transferase subunit B n=1 Tax=Candidatus Terasakiella magnetica TaxID=1867952 RepID=A0A1C3RFI8_9PROT|nr:CoA-transferase subunit beta [Candidatus Terasakiella magnetica]SCA56029.1 3-oxoadipate CoA-transferase subunit B [Candidatus Terasakiella magnetica]